MAKKKKRRIQAPSLSPLDKGIYFLLMACSVTAGFFLYPAIIGSFRSSVFEDTRILAQNNPGAIILAFWGIILGVGVMLLIDWLRRRKQPIFGKADITYGPPQWKSVYPLLSKQFWRIALKERKRFLAVLSAALLIVVFSMVAVVLCLPSRECLRDDGSVEAYNSFNKNTASYDATDVVQIRIYTRKFIDHNGWDDWAVEMEITMRDGENFFFSYYDFITRDEKIHASIAGLYRIKNCFAPGLVVLEGKENIQKVIRDMYLNPQEIELLYLLFDMDTPVP